MDGETRIERIERVVCLRDGDLQHEFGHGLFFGLRSRLATALLGGEPAVLAYIEVYVRGLRELAIHNVQSRPPASVSRESDLRG